MPAEGGDARNHEAEIEAAARAFVIETPITHPFVGEIGPSAPAAVRYERAREALVAALDAVRRSPHVNLTEFQEGLTRALNRRGVPAMPSWDAAIDWLAEHGGRSPQGEDHEAIEAAARALYDDWPREGPWEELPEHTRNAWRGKAQGAIAAYLSRCPSPERNTEKEN